MGQSKLEILSIKAHFVVLFTLNSPLICMKTQLKELRKMSMLKSCVEEREEKGKVISLSLPSSLSTINLNLFKKSTSAPFFLLPNSRHLKKLLR